MNERKVTIDIMLLEDITVVLKTMLEIISEKDLTDKELDRLRYVNKVILNCNELFRKNVKEMENE